MQYREAGKTGEKLSLIGYGCMRFSRKGLGVNQAKTEAELAYALEKGINYFDVAYNYPGCEEALGKFLVQGDNRSRVILATKLPQFMCKSAEDFDRYFNEQLKRLQTDHIDFYLIHMLTSSVRWDHLVEMGIEAWIEKKKTSGQIKHIGFSYHGGREDYKRIVDAYPWEFTQIQLNYLDAGAQAGMEGLHYAAERGIPVIIMEPLRGGRLANQLPSSAKAIFEKESKKAIQGDTTPSSNAGWGLQWLYNLPEVTCVLSGMNEISQIEENAQLACAVEANSLSEETLQVYDRVIDEIHKVEKVGCTGCGYCLPCPKGVDIPTCFRSYNYRFSDNWFMAMKDYVMATTLKEKPSNAGACVGCGKCAKHCPQHIDIPKEMEEVKRTLEGPVYKVINVFKGFFVRN